ncbi:cytochrome ubiquinol oxidase subunit II [Coxiella endosymbiont of Ornithodoros amblus]|uniref:COX aromatic rich motif-containing protein n=1 Tax=Coxiella endosymbiont of Ornithodoros amblus TaxID=1656166 RepID=UPI00244E1655|nr:COX aromatic rich motif-containing protein [Coxiella endosymbiont of Ornithodoros amblus]MBW5802514.1 cytochrome ubiquinol oxidase subunit II [Coxiella endosymbiont of Ornithodoros amblus]
MKNIVKFFIFFGVLLAGLSLVGCHSLKGGGILNPEGTISFEERQLFFDSLALMLIVVIPVFIMSFTFIFRYRAGHKTSDYKPNWGHSALLETIWWGVPCGIIIILGIMTWSLTHKLDPYRKIDVPGKPLLIQAVALPWKWLFIYPEQNIATVNYLKLPKEQQIEFWFTSDNVPMSAFFIPELGSQIYTMAGMRTRLHLLALKDGNYWGLNTQYNGDGFSDMCFKVKVVEPDELQHWFEKAKKSKEQLTLKLYQNLIHPSMKGPVRYFSSVAPNLFSQIIMKYKQTTRIPRHWAIPQSD